MEFSKSPIPLYFQVEKKLREKVSNLEIVGEDGRLPSEDQLCQLFRVSRITIRKALSELVADGLIYRKSGKGTFLLPEKKRTFSIQLAGNLEDLVSLGAQTKMKLLSQRLIDPPPHIQAKLNLLGQEKVFYYEGLRLIGKEPFTYFNAYVSPSIGKFFTRSDLKGKMTIFRLLEGITGIRIMEAEQLITASLVDGNVAKHLKMKIGDPILLMERIYYSSERKPMEVAVSYFRPDRYQYKIKLTRGIPRSLE